MAMNLTVMVSGSVDYLSHMSYTSSLRFKSLLPYELLEYHLITQLILNWKKSTKQTNSSIINKCKIHYKIGVQLSYSNTLTIV
jgi:hypothetical protein